MRKLVVMTFLTLDGVMQAPGGRVEDTDAGFAHGGWQMQFDDEDNTMAENLQNAGALLLGRKTYDIFAGYWPTEGKDIPVFGPLMNNITKYVASHTTKKLNWQNSNLLTGEFESAVNKIKNENGKDIYVIGSSNLIQDLRGKNLVDEYILLVHPIVLGSGKQLFQQNGFKHELELINSKATKTGITVQKYKVKK